MQLNHIFRTRDIVTKNDSKVAKHGENVTEQLLAGGGFLDHGFTRPKVVLIVFCDLLTMLIAFQHSIIASPFSLLGL